MDDGEQGDLDGDQAETSVTLSFGCRHNLCEPPDPDDWDGDGVTDAEDNALLENVDQSDRDRDRIGDILISVPTCPT